MAAPTPADDLSALIARADAGDTHARESLFSRLYDELHRLAQHQVRRAGPHSPLGATTLLHEAYLAFGDRHGSQFPDESRFMGYAARAMRGLIIDHVRAARAEKRGGGEIIRTLDTESAQNVTDPSELSAVHDALEELATVDPALAQVVDLHFFCGFAFNEIAAMHGVSDRTVQRQWQKARIYLRDALRTFGPA